MTADPAVEVWRCAWREHVTPARRYPTDRPRPVQVTKHADFDTEQAATDWALSLASAGRVVGEAAIYPIPIKESA